MLMAMFEAAMIPLVAFLMVFLGASVDRDLRRKENKR